MILILKLYAWIKINRSHFTEIVRYRQKLVEYKWEIFSLGYFTILPVDLYLFAATIYYNISGNFPDVIKAYKKRREEAERRDHRTIGQALNLFSIQARRFTTRFCKGLLERIGRLFGEY